MRQRIEAGDGDPRHGTHNGYTNLRCRCDRCRAANTASHREWAHRSGYSRPAEDVNYIRARNADCADNHGTEYRYTRGCRCDACRAASAAARRIRRLTPNVAVHGAYGYANGCRCDACRTGNNARSSANRAKR